MLAKNDCITRLVEAGISRADAEQLRRISMTLHRWHELECGDGNDYASWTIARGRKDHAPDCPVMFAVDSADHGPCNCRRSHFVYDDNGTPFEEKHVRTENKARYTPIADRERGALKRLAAIMARYPAFRSYIQGDPRGASLYILRPGDVPEGGADDAYYSRGIAVYK